MQTLYLSEDNLVEWDLMTLGSDATYVNNATVTFALKTLAGVTVTGATGTLAYVAASNGKYQGTLVSTVALTAGTEYDLEITAVSGANDGFRRIRCLAAYHAET